MQPGHMASAPRYMDALKGTMRKFDEWIGPYPYPQITVVDPPHGGGAAGGMEYPTLITARHDVVDAEIVAGAGDRGGARIRAPVLVRHGGHQRI